MSKKQLQRFLHKILLPFFWVTFFWQTRINILNAYEVYDYLIPFLYLSDISILLILVTQTYIDPKWIEKINLPRILIVGMLVVLIILMIQSFGVTHSVGAYYRLGKIVLFSVFSLWVSVYVDAVKAENVWKLIGIGGFGLVAIGVGEMLIGRSLGIQFIGEWYFSVHHIGIANVWLWGEKILRPYASFPHPNVFGGVMAVLSVSWWGFVVQKSKRVDRQWVHTIGVVLVLGVIISFSRMAWISLLASFVYFVVDPKRLKKLGAFSRVWYFWGGFIVGLFSFATLTRVQDLFDVDYVSLARRLELNAVAIRIWLDNIVLGVGLNQVIFSIASKWRNASLPIFIQPIHNVPLLVLAETGLVGVIAMMGIGYKTIITQWKLLGSELQMVWVVIGVISLGDHYWWTLQPGMLVLFLTWGMTLARMKLHSKV